MNIRVNARKAKAFTSAFTLIEVIMSVVIIGIAAAGLIACFTGSFFVMRMARENQRATQVLIERAEAIRVFTWTDMTNGNLPSTFTDYFDPSYAQFGGQEGVTYNGTVTTGSVPFSTSYNTNMLLVTLTVNWTTDGVNRSRTLKTIYSFNGSENYVY
jgi:prepilin-type N-terminal cleavage/methylation domain-containing protein